MKKQKQAASERGNATVHDGPATQIHLIRHAPVIGDGRVYGRRDLCADCGDTAAFARLRAALPNPDSIVISPAARCRQTAQALWPARQLHPDPALWEQDFGDWEGMPFGDIPDHGRLDGAALSAFAPPNGESFDDVCARVAPALQGLPTGNIAIVAHAGSIRAALSAALGGVPTALRFEIANLSVTTLRLLPGGAFSLREVNRCP